MVDRNRKDSLQLLRVQNDLNSLGLAMRDMLDAHEPYPLTAWSSQFERIREDLDAALKLEASVSPTTRTEDQRRFLNQALSDRKSTRLNSSHLGISYAVFCLKK